ncbi:MAG: ABC transporter permease [Atopobiaceae bacterium]|nr:ABC transporter permease [Atopobiaceae bacterium]
MRGNATTSLLRRLLYSLITIVGVAALVFVLLRMVPGNPVATLLGERADAETVERISSSLGLDKPLPVQFADYVLGALSGDFGESFTLGKPVVDLIGPAFMNTLRLAIAAALVAWVVGIACGLFAATHKGALVDRLFMGISLLGVSLPVFMVAMLLQYVFARYLHWLPVAGISDWTGYVLPAIALGWGSAGSVARLVRSSVIEELQQDYIDTARAKGRTKRQVLVLHALRNAMLPVITLMAMQFSGLLSGAFITETVFSINGIGRLSVQAITGRDIPLLQGTTLLIAFVIVMGNLVADLLYGISDPRVRKGV